MAYLLIDPGETLDYTFDFGPFLDEGGSPSDTIVADSPVLTITPQSGSPQSPDLSGVTNTVSTVTVFVTNATVGERYHLTCTVVTAQGRTAQRSLTIKCEQR